MNDLEQYGFKDNTVDVTQNKSMQATSEAKAIAEVQAAYVIAKKYPRNQNQAFVNIIDSCKRPFLAEQALYAYPKGKQMVEGPSIRLAEVLAQNWGNMKFGADEISRSHGMSVVYCYAIDLETNTQASKIIHVPHVRSTKNGNVTLTSERDIYEAWSNQASRRIRACILAVIPGDIVEASTNQVRKTLESSDIPLKEQVRKMVLAFDEYGINVELIEKRLGHKLEAIIPTEIVTLKSVYKSIKDGMAPREAFFDIETEAEAEKQAAELDSLIDKKKKPEVKKEKQTETTTEKDAN